MLRFKSDALDLGKSFQKKFQINIISFSRDILRQNCKV